MRTYVVMTIRLDLGMEVTQIQNVYVGHNEELAQSIKQALSLDPAYLFVQMETWLNEERIGAESSGGIQIEDGVEN